MRRPIIDLMALPNRDRLGRVPTEPAATNQDVLSDLYAQLAEAFGDEIFSAERRTARDRYIHRAQRAD